MNKKSIVLFGIIILALSVIGRIAVRQITNRRTQNHIMRISRIFS